MTRKMLNSESQCIITKCIGPRPMKRVRTSRDHLCDLQSLSTTGVERVVYNPMTTRHAPLLCATSSNCSITDGFPGANNGTGTKRYINCFFYGFYATDDYLLSYGIKTNESTGGLRFDITVKAKSMGDLDYFVECVLSILGV